MMTSRAMKIIRMAFLRIFYKNEIKHIQSRIKYLWNMRKSDSNQFHEDYFLAKLDELLIVANAFDVIERQAK